MNTGLAALKSVEDSSQQSSGIKFFKLSDGESCTIRLLTGIDNMVVYTHHATKADGTPCTAQLLEMSKTEWDDLVAAGQRPICPVCGQPIQDSDIVYIRDGIVEVDKHSALIDGQRKLFYCMNNVDSGYPCPLCEQVVEGTKRDGSTYMKKNKPQKRIYGWCVLRQKHTTPGVNAQGMPIVKVDSVVDVMEDVDGEMRPAVRLIDMGVKNFWSKFNMFYKNNGTVGYYDFDITRSGAQMDTVYDVAPVDMASAIPVDRRQYDNGDETLHDKFVGLVTYMSSPEYYSANGVEVPGYVPAQQNAAQQGAVQAQVPAPVAQPMSTQQIPAPAPAPIQAAPAPVQAAPAPAQPAQVQPAYQQTQVPQNGTPWTQINASYDA